METKLLRKKNFKSWMRNYNVKYLPGHPTDLEHWLTLHVKDEITVMIRNIVPDKARFHTKKYRYFSNLTIKTYVVGTH